MHAISSSSPPRVRLALAISRSGESYGNARDFAVDLDPSSRARARKNQDRRANCVLLFLVAVASATASCCCCPRRSSASMASFVDVVCEQCIDEEAESIHSSNERQRRSSTTTSMHLNIVKKLRQIRLSISIAYQQQQSRTRVQPAI